MLAWLARKFKGSKTSKGNSVTHDLEKDKNVKRGSIQDPSFNENKQGSVQEYWALQFSRTQKEELEKINLKEEYKNEMDVLLGLGDADTLYKFKQKVGEQGLKDFLKLRYDARKSKDEQVSFAEKTKRRNRFTSIMRLLYTEDPQKMMGVSDDLKYYLLDHTKSSEELDQLLHSATELNKICAIYKANKKAEIDQLLTIVRNTRDKVSIDALVDELTKKKLEYLSVFQISKSDDFDRDIIEKLDRVVRGAWYGTQDAPVEEEYATQEREEVVSKEDDVAQKIDRVEDEVESESPDFSLEEKELDPIIDQTIGVQKAEMYKDIYKRYDVWDFYEKYLFYGDEDRKQLHQLTGDAHFQAQILVCMKEQAFKNNIYMSPIEVVGYMGLSSDEERIRYVQLIRDAEYDRNGVLEYYNELSYDDKETLRILEGGHRNQAAVLRGILDYKKKQGIDFSVKQFNRFLDLTEEERTEIMQYPREQMYRILDCKTMRGTRKLLKHPKKKEILEMDEKMYEKYAGNLALLEDFTVSQAERYFKLKPEVRLEMRKLKLEEQKNLLLESIDDRKERRIELNVFQIWNNNEFAYRVGGNPDSNPIVDEQLVPDDRYRDILRVIRTYQNSRTYDVICRLHQLPKKSDKSSNDIWKKIQKLADDGQYELTNLYEMVMRAAVVGTKQFDEVSKEVSRVLSAYDEITLLFNNKGVDYHQLTQNITTRDAFKKIVLNSLKKKKKDEGSSRWEMPISREPSDILS